MIGIVLTAGGGTRLRPLTDDLPKALLPVDGDRSILELAVANLSDVGIDEIVLVTGHAAQRIRDVVPRLEKEYGVSLVEVFNERFADWNNAYSLWLAREHFERGAMLVNGDTVHPVEVERRMLDARGAGPLVIALDDQKKLAEEEMKVYLDDRQQLTRINKGLDPDAAAGEYIGVTLIEPEASEPLADALKRTFESDTSLYYEDGFQAFADVGGEIRTTSVGGLDWVEVDDHRDLERAREITCHY